jgi:hypothetical protein
VGLAGLGLTATGVGAPIGVPMMIGGTTISLAPTVETLGKKVYKTKQGTIGWDREHYATALWYLGEAKHKPSIDYMIEMGILDKDGDYIKEGFFEEKSKANAIQYIKRKLRS